MCKVSLLWVHSIQNRAPHKTFRCHRGHGAFGNLGQPLGRDAHHAVAVAMQPVTGADADIVDQDGTSVAVGSQQPTTSRGV